ncbi:MAG: heme peroxidase [Thermoleophilia bacterium]|nr:heme peroxidase [Thermoleophilia bacterium]
MSRPRGVRAGTGPEPVRRTFRTLRWGEARPSSAQLAALFTALLCAAFLAVDLRTSSAAPAPAGQGFVLNAGDMRFILKQIKIAENHATREGPDGQPVAGAPLVGSGPNQIANPLLPYGLRTVDGSENNLQPGQGGHGAANKPFPRLAAPSFMTAEDSNIPGMGPVGPPGGTTYAQKAGSVVDSRPRTVSNLIVDQTESNPAAVKAAGRPNRTFLGQPAIPCSAPNAPPAGTCIPKGQTLPIPNVTTDVGLSPPFNSWFTIFGQFFDHGIDSTTKSGGTVFVPLKDDDPLIAGPDGQRGTSDDLPVRQRFMVLTRAKNQPGPDGRLGTPDDIQNATNTDSSWVDQSQTYASHPAHHVFLREYAMVGGKPVATGGLIEGDKGGMAPWAKVKAEAASKLGIRLVDADALDVPMLATDQYGRFLRGTNGLPQIATASGLVQGNLTTPVRAPADAQRTGVAFLDDIAHHAVPKAGLTADGDTAVTDVNAQQPAGTYDDEMLDAHFIAGDGRVNENIALTAVHQVFHSEHNRLVAYMKQLIVDNDIDVAEWKSAAGADGWNGERLFQAARFVTEMEYQHLVFEEFGRKISPAIPAFNPATQSQTDLDPAVKAEFAHAVYRFGHSMLTDTVARTNDDGTKNDIPLLDAFLSPQAYTDGGNGRVLSPESAAGSIAMGMADQVGNELDEFVSDTLRNNLLGLPLDLAALNMTRARETGVPSLNAFRRDVHRKSGDGALKPYTDWVDYGLSIRHRDSLVNFMAAYGRHPTITAATTLAGKRAAAKAIYDNDPAAAPAPPGDAEAFMNSTGTWADVGGKSVTGLDDVDLWVGGLAETQNLFGGLLGSTFNYVFEQQLTDLQNGDRFYYLTRTPGLNLRNQLEGNSFAELVQRNTDAHGLKADVFSTADCEFDIAHLQGTTPGPITDDPTSECNEHDLLLRMADGTIRYRQSNSVDPGGLNAQSTYEGTAGADRVWGGVDNDTFWGNLGDDRIEGNDGSDNALGGEGDDIITDSAGDDVLKGGPGNDAIDAGPGLDLLMPGVGDDFTDGGLNSNETFAGPGDDLMLGGEGIDGMFGDSGDDWLDGGRGGDEFEGDAGNNFFTDDDEPGSDVLVSGGGESNYDAEGGDDIMFDTADHDRNAGAMGYDWVVHKGSASPADSDMDLAIAVLPQPQVVVRDRFSEVEGLSGWKLNDVLRGNGRAAEVALPADRNDLKPAGIAQIAGLPGVLNPGVTTLRGDQNIILGGVGSDTIEGREGDDFIDGDKWLDAQLRVPNLTTASTTDTILVDNLSDVRDDLMAGRMNPGQADIVRSVKTPTIAETQNDTDTAVFSGPRADYDITPNFNTTLMTVTHARGAATDGTDVLRGIETVQFSDQSLSIRPLAVFGPPLTFAGQPVNTNSATQPVQLSNSGNQLLVISSIALAGANAGDFQIVSSTCGASLAPGASCTVNVRFRPTASGARAAVLRATDNSGGTAGATQEVALSGTGIVPNQPATGAPTLSDTTPQTGQVLTANTGGIADGNGLGTFSFQWQRTNQAGNAGTFANIAGATNATFQVPGGADPVGRRYRVVVTFTDGDGFPESLTSAASARTTPAPNQPATGVPTLSDTTPQPNQVLTANTSGIADGNGLGTFTFRWQQTNAAGNVGTFANIGGAAGAGSSFTVPAAANSAGRRYRVVVSFVDAAGFPEQRVSAASARTTNGPNVLALQATNVQATTQAPLTVAATVPAGARLAQISVVAQPSGTAAEAPAKGAKVHGRLIGSVLRTTPKGKRYSFRLTEGKLRSLRPGRYLLSLRVGADRSHLGPATTRSVVVKAGKGTGARGRG